MFESLALCFGGIGAFTFHKLRACRQPAVKVTAEAIEEYGHKFVQLPDGRKLEYVVKGDPKGVPVVYTHGYMMSCYTGPVVDKVCKSNNVKWIAITMPGFGFSDVYPNFEQRSLMDYPQDILAVLNKEGVLEPVHLMGFSAGCLHAAAVAYYLPAKRVGNMLCCSPTCPDELPGATDGMNPATKVFKTLNAIPYVADFIAKKLAEMPAKSRLCIAPDCEAALARGEVEMPERTEEVFEACNHAMEWTHRGMVDNWSTVSKPLPFPLKSLSKLVESGHAVGITSAPDDETNPPNVQRIFAGEIEGCQLLEFKEGWGHLHIMPEENFQRMLQFLINGKDMVTKNAKLQKRQTMPAPASEKMANDGIRRHDSMEGGLSNSLSAKVRFAKREMRRSLVHGLPFT